MGKALVSDDKFAADEIRFIIGISFILGLRQFGMMLVMPFLSVYGMTLSGASSALVGISLGIYALTQGCLQVPYGIISDRIGRKPVVIFGILLQIAGFILAFKAKRIQLIIFARALQGSGAMRIISTVSSVAIALSLIFGTILQRLISIPQIFLICVGLSALAFLYFVFVLREGVKAAPALKTKKWTESKDALRNAIVNKPLLRLYVTGFLANFMLTGVFFIMPHIAGSSSGMDSLKTLLIAIPVIIIAMKIANSYADKGKYSLVQIVIFSTFTLSVPCLFLRSAIINSVSIIIFFAGIMCQYYLITAGVNQLADKRYRATINGVSNTIGFTGSFLGGVVTGVFWDVGITATMSMLAAACLLGLAAVCTGLI